MIKTKLIFSIGYDSFVYKEEKNLFNKKFVGELQLLSLLERELGLSGEFSTNKERQAEYLEYLSQKINENNSFISESFNNDKIGVANELLRWRDQLKLMNWNFTKGISERMNLLSEIENENNVSLGTSDRWILVLNKLKSTENINVESVEINDSVELLHPILKEIFNLLERKGVKIIQKEKEKEFNGESNLTIIKNSIVKNISEIELDRNDKSFQVIKFSDSIISADFLAQQLSKKKLNPIVINSNNYGLDTSFLTFDLPCSGSEITNVNPQILQLFKLLSFLLFKKVDPYNLLSLLNLPILPFPKSLANNLSKILIQNAGIGNKDWIESIEKYKKNIDQNRKNWKEKVKAVEFYLERERKDKITKKDLIDIYRDIISWSGKMISVTETENIKIQLVNLQVLSKSLVKTIESLNAKEFSAKELNKITAKIYNSVNIKINCKEKGSYTVLSQPAQLHNSADFVIWFDFYNRTLLADYGEFLMQEEIEELLKQDNILFWRKENQIQLQLENLQKGILKANSKLVLFIPEKTNGEKTLEHPLQTQLTSLIKNFDDFVIDFSFDENNWDSFGWGNPDVSEIERSELPKELDYIQIGKSDLLHKRSVESYSSINDLIQYPLDWVMKYQAKITEKGLGKIAELITIKGNLSHVIVQTLLQKEKDGEINFDDVNIDDEIDKLLDEYTPQEATPFYLAENTFEYKTFQHQLKESFKVLLNIIKNNNLKYDSFEFEGKGTIDEMEIFGKIDLLFYKDEIPVIIDLKWTFSSKKYETILEKEKSMQLAIYAKLIKNERNPVTAYFLLSKGELYTTNELLKGAGVRIIKINNPVDVNDRIIEKTINSINYRWNELKSGKIEQAEEKALEVIQYSKDTEANELIPLDNMKKTKKPNQYSEYKLFKGKVK